MGISRLIRKEAHFADIDQWNESFILFLASFLATITDGNKRQGEKNYLRFKRGIKAVA